MHTATGLEDLAAHLPLPRSSGVCAAVPEPTGSPRITPALLDRKRNRTSQCDLTPVMAAARPEPVELPGTLAELERRLELSQAGLARARSEITELLAEQKLLLADLDRSKARNVHLHEQLDRARRKWRGAQNRPNPSSAEPESWFVDPEEQLRYEILIAWVRRVPAGEKADRPLPEYFVGRGFVESINRLQGISRSKIIDVVVDVLTGHAVHLAGRGIHPLRTGDGAEAGPVVRNDGAMCWRVALQVNTPSARRLHYWQLPNKIIELSRVVLHDDYTP